MKQIFKKHLGKCIKFVILVSLSIFFLLVGLYYPGKNYTNAYNVYKETKNITTVDELKEYCVNKGIHYKIINYTMTLIPDKKTSVDYQINDGQVSIISDDLPIFNLLEYKDSGDVQITTYEEDGKILEQVAISKGYSTYYTRGGEFYKEFVPQKALLAIATTVLLTCSIVYFIALIIYFYDDIKTHRKAKKITSPSPTYKEQNVN